MISANKGSVIRIRPCIKICMYTCLHATCTSSSGEKKVDKHMHLQMAERAAEGGESTGTFIIIDREVYCS